MVHATHLPDDRVRRQSFKIEGEIARYIWQDSERLHGVPCFFSTRVPIEILFDHLSSGETLEEFLRGFPEVSRESALAVLQLASHALQDSLHAK